MKWSLAWASLPSSPVIPWGSEVIETPFFGILRRCLKVVGRLGKV